MNEVQWTDKMSVGVDLIDGQHKMWIQHLNDLSQAVEAHLGPEKIAETLGFLIDYTHFHFSAEEKYMAEYHYEPLEAHRAKHEHFKEILSDLELEFREEGPTQNLVEACSKLLVNWLLQHIREVDTEFGAFLKSRNIVLPE